MLPEGYAHRESAPDTQLRDGLFGSVHDACTHDCYGGVLEGGSEGRRVTEKAKRRECM